MEQLQHFSHDHLLSLVHLQSNHKNESSDEEEEEKHEDVDDFVAEDHHVGQCNMCKEQIYSFHLCYYQCKDCNYSLHKFCAEMPTTIQNHPLHPNHNLTLAEKFQYFNYINYAPDYEWTCGVCNLKRKLLYNYHCRICKFDMDIICATMSQQKMDHPSHPHQLQRNSKQLVSRCNACSHEHEGTFYHCITCSFSIHLGCALLPSKLLIQQSTNGTFTHSHPLTLAYSFPIIEKRAKFFPRCRVCGEWFYIYFWLYKCDKCRYYVHSECGASKIEPYMSIFLPAGYGTTRKNYVDEDHPDLLHCPFPDESYNLLKHHFHNKKDVIVKETNGEMLNHFSHQHPLILLDKQTSLGNKSVFLHDPMKKVQLLCDGCVKPITEFPFYKCSKDIPHCGFVLHEWCARLPSEVQDHPGHREHTLVLLPNITKFFGVFVCAICILPSNSFAYGCMICDYYVDINCAFLPKEITHEAHPGHLLLRIDVSSSKQNKVCNACRYYLKKTCIAFHCPACDFYLDTECAFLLPRMIRHKYDKHPLSLRYKPVENHPGNYFCEICEDEFDPNNEWLYHCSFCAQSMHPSCTPLILGCEQNVYSKYKRCVFQFSNVKFGGTLKIKGHPHPLVFAQGIRRHGLCKKCDDELVYEMIFKCLVCEYALDYDCASLLGN